MCIMPKKNSLPNTAERFTDPHLPEARHTSVGIGTFTACEVAARSQGPFPPSLLIRMTSL